MSSVSDVLLVAMGAAALAPVGGLVGLLVPYAALRWRGVSEREGRRGCLALFCGALPAALLASLGGGWLAWHCLEGATPVHRFVLATLSGLLAVQAALIGGVVAGIRLAETRGISNYAGERALWALSHVALPLACVLGGTAFMAVWAG